MPTEFFIYIVRFGAIFRDKLGKIFWRLPVAEHDFLPEHSDYPNEQCAQESFEPDSRCQQRPMSDGVTVY